MGEVLSMNDMKESKQRVVVKEALAHPERFIEWLGKQESTDSVGVPSLPNKCPLCEYLASRGLIDPIVQLSYVVVGYGDDVYRGKRSNRLNIEGTWMGDFQDKAMDATKRYDDYDEYTEITAGECLEVMAEIKELYGGIYSITPI